MLSQLTWSQYTLSLSSFFAGRNQRNELQLFTSPKWLKTMIPSSPGEHRVIPGCTGMLGCLPLPSITGAPQPMMKSHITRPLCVLGQMACGCLVSCWVGWWVSWLVLVRWWLVSCLGHNLPFYWQFLDLQTTAVQQLELPATRNSTIVAHHSGTVDSNG